MTRLLPTVIEGLGEDARFPYLCNSYKCSSQTSTGVQNTGIGVAEELKPVETKLSWLLWGGLTLTSLGLLYYMSKKNI